MKSDLESAAQMALDTILTAIARHPGALDRLFKPTISSLRWALKIETPSEESSKEWEEYVRLFAASGRPERGGSPIPHDHWMTMTDVGKIGHIELLMADVAVQREKLAQLGLAERDREEQARAIAERPATFGTW